jgi:hypothetical protein
VLHGKRVKTCLPIDIAIPDDSKVNTKETEKLNTYKDLITTHLALQSVHMS